MTLTTNMLLLLFVIFGLVFGKLVLLPQLGLFFR